MKISPIKYNECFHINQKKVTERYIQNLQTEKKKTYNNIQKKKIKKST